MVKTKKFSINNQIIECPVFEKGQRVKPKDGHASAIGAKGTVESTSQGGLFVSVLWDKEKFECETGGTCELGKLRLVDGLELITD